MLKRQIKNIIFVYIILIVLTNNCAHAAHIYPEKVYQHYWCQKVCGVVEYRLPQGQRVDCLTKTHAIEFDFANKVYEGIGQAIYYSVATGLKPGIVLIIEEEKDKKYLEILKMVSKNKSIDYWIITPSELQRKQANCNKFNLFGTQNKLTRLSFFNLSL